MNLKLLQNLYLVTLLNFVKGNDGGGPASEENCQKLIPLHRTPPQKTPSPYTIYLSEAEVKGGESVRIMMYSSKKHTKIKGFFLQGRKVNYKTETEPMGTFMVDDNYKGSKLIKCGHHGDSSMTHTDSGDKDHVRAVWVAPNEPGTYVILCTIVKNGNVFWVRQPSLKIVVH